MAFTDQGGHVRREGRIRWWIEDARPSWNEWLIVPNTAGTAVPDAPIDEGMHTPYIPKEPIFIGHYSLIPQNGQAFEPKDVIVSSKVACLDWHRLDGGPLVAYRWVSGDASIMPENVAFV